MKRHLRLTSPHFRSLSTVKLCCATSTRRTISVMHSVRCLMAKMLKKVSTEFLPRHNDSIYVTDSTLVRLTGRRNVGLEQHRMRVSSGKISLHEPWIKCWLKVACLSWLRSTVQKKSVSPLHSGGLLIPSNVLHPGGPSLNLAVMSAHTCTFWITIHSHLFFFFKNQSHNGYSKRIYYNLINI